VTGLIYDRFGDFEGFWLLTEEGHRHQYCATETEIESIVRFAWTDRVLIEVLSSGQHPAVPIRIVLLRVQRP
jgi:hypothetical protein